MSAPPFIPAPIEPEKSWFRRHLAITIVMGVALAAVGFVVLLVFGLLSLLKSSDVYQQAVTKARNSPAVVEALGSPVQPGWWLTGSINVNGSSGSADIAIPISGPKGKGMVYAVASKQEGVWHFKRLEVGVEGRPQKISLTPLSPADIREE